MTDFIIGIDPDSELHGVAIYIDGELVDLLKWDTITVVNYCRTKPNSNMLVSIEDVCSQDFVYARNNQATKAAQAKIGRNIGMVQQAQKELTRWLDFWGVEYVLHKPTKHNWAKDKLVFERVTGWDRRSNEDTRSASYMGWLEVGRKELIF